MPVKTFRRGSSTYKCNVCGRGTRDVGDNGSCRLCPQCYELAGEENGISDGHYTLAERKAVIQEFVNEIKAKGGDVSTWIEVFELEAL